MTLVRGWLQLTYRQLTLRQTRLFVPERHFEDPVGDRLVSLTLCRLRERLLPWTVNVYRPNKSLYDCGSVGPETGPGVLVTLPRFKPVTLPDAVVTTVHDEGGQIRQVVYYIT